MIDRLRKKSVLVDKAFANTFEHQIIGEKLRYLFVGGICALSDLAILFVLVDVFRIWYLAASVISFLLVLFLGYAGQKYFTFRDVTKNHGKQLTVFFLVVGVGLLINSLSMYFFVSILGFWYIFGSILTKFIVLVWNFTANKYITFKSD